MQRVELTWCSVNHFVCVVAFSSQWKGAGECAAHIFSSTELLHQPMSQLSASALSLCVSCIVAVATSRMYTVHCVPVLYICSAM